MQLISMFEQAPSFMAILQGPSLVYEIVNEAYYQLVGHRDLIGWPVRDALPELEGQAYLELLQQVYSSGEPYIGREMPVRFQEAPDAPMTDAFVDIRFHPLRDADGCISGILIQGQDVTEQKHAKDALHVSNERLKFALEGARDGTWDWDVSENRATYSGRWAEILGYDIDEVGDDVEAWASLIHPDDRAVALERLNGTMNGEKDFHVEYRLRCKDGGYKWVLSRGITVARDNAGRPARLAGTMSDISEKKASDELVWRHASFDTLTGLPNRRLFRDRLEQEVHKAHRSGNEIALLFIDLDRFKEVNDMLGHDAGDHLLTQVATRLTACVRDADTVARLGGDEFTVILTDLHGHPHIECISQKIIDKLAEPFQLKGEQAYISASVGITLYPIDAKGSEELIRNADQAMYAAKGGGRNQFRIFTKSMQKDAQERVQLTRDLREALPRGQLQVHFQPIVDLRSHQIVKAEALLRWKHPRLGYIRPEEFIALAEESGLIHGIGDWVFTEAAAWAERWGAVQGKPFEISVNRSPVQFMSKSATDWADILQKKGLPARSIAVEITEGILLNASSKVVEALDHYRDGGIQVALDDFGTGYSSLAYLKRFHIDYLKIDQSFVRDIDVNEGSRAIAESMIVMAHRLGLKVIAEGVENAEQETVLRMAGCDFAQGFLFSRALPPVDFTSLLRDGFPPSRHSSRAGT